MNILQILEGGKLSPSYDNVLDFKDIVAQDKYWEGKTIAIREINNVDTPIAFFEEYPAPVAIPFSMNEAKGFNYMRIKVQTGTDSFGRPIFKWYYYFITKVEYNTPLTVFVKLQLDVWQTYLFDYTFYESFIEREHQDRYTKDGTPIFNRMPEDLDLGDKGLVSEPNILEKDEFLWFHIITKTAIGIKKNLPSGQVVNATNDYRATFNGLNQGFFHYLIPFNPKEPNRQYFTMQGGVNKPLQISNEILQGLATSEQTVSIRLLPYCPIPYTYDASTYSFTFTDEVIIQQPSNTAFAIADEIGSPSGTGTRYKITYVPTTNGSVIGQEYSKPGEPVPLTIKPQDGYKIVSLRIEDTNGGVIPNDGRTFTMPGSNVNVYSKFDVDTIAYSYKITFDSDKAQVSPSEGTAEENDWVYINIDDKTGYSSQITSANVEYYKTNSGIKFRMPANDVNITVTSKEITIIPITWSANNRDWFSQIDVPISVLKGQKFRIEIRASEGYYIKSVPVYAYFNSAMKPEQLVPDVRKSETVTDASGYKKYVYYKIDYTAPINASSIGLQFNGAQLDKPEPPVVERHYYTRSINPAGGGNIYIDVPYFVENDTIKFKVIANYVEDEYTGGPTYECVPLDMGGLQIKEASGLQTPLDPDKYGITIATSKTTVGITTQKTIIYKYDVTINKAPNFNILIEAVFKEY